MNKLELTAITVTRWSIPELADAARGIDYSTIEQAIALVGLWGRANEAYCNCQLRDDWQVDLEDAQSILSEIELIPGARGYGLLQALLESTLEAIDCVLQTARFDPFYAQDWFGGE